MSIRASPSFPCNGEPRPANEDAVAHRRDMGQQRIAQTNVPEGESDGEESLEPSEFEEESQNE